MPIWLYDDQGVRRTVKSSWYSDGVKMWPVRCMWVANESGALKQSSDCVGLVQCSIQALSHTAFRVSWNAAGAAKVRIYGIGNPDPLLGEYTSAASYADYYGFTPNQIVTVYAVGFDAQGYSSQSPRVTTTLHNIPAPASISADSATTSSYNLYWAGVDSASRYDVYNAQNNGLLHQTSATSWGRGGLNPGTAYYTYVKAVHANGSVSGASPHNGIATTARFPAGTYFFYPHWADTWQGGTNSWRTDKSQMWHGDGGAFGAAGGSRHSFFGDYREYYGGKNIVDYFSGYPVNVARVQIRTMRSSTKHGIYSGQTCRYQRHNHASKPSSGATGIHEAVQPGTLALGENKWFDLPVHWGAEWIAGMWNMGMIWGGTPYYSNGAGYMYGPNLSAMANQCEVAITTS
jgi:hypothetical protein